DGQVVEGPVVPQPREVRHGHGPDDLGVAEHVGHTRRRHHEISTVVPCSHADVLDLGPDRDGDVRYECPWRRRPNEEVEVDAVGGETDIDRRLGDVPVGTGLAELVARQGRPAPAAVGHDLEAFVDEVTVPHLTNDPPDALDVL